MASARTIHYKISLVAAALILTTAVTGLLWAYAPYMYWQPGYLEKKQSGPELPLDGSVLPLATLLTQVPAELVENNQLRAITLRSDGGQLVYEVKSTSGVALYDAQSGAPLSPIEAAFAERLARQYVAGNPKIAQLEEQSPWEDRKGKVHKSTWQVRFDDPAETEIVLDRNSGAILEDSDRVRRFHFFVMKLHQFNFFGTRKVLTVVSGLPLIILTLTGLALGLKRARLQRRGKVRPGQARPMLRRSEEVGA